MVQSFIQDARHVVTQFNNGEVDLAAAEKELTTIFKTNCDQARSKGNAFLIFSALQKAAQKCSQATKDSSMTAFQHFCNETGFHPGD